MKEACLSKYPSVVKIFSQKTNVNLRKATANNNAY